MATLSFHVPPATERKIRAAAKKREMTLSRYLLTVTEQAATGAPVSGFGRELEKLAIDGMAVAAVGRIRARTATTGADKMSPARITAAIKAARRARA
jgi:hypothetical protein